MVTDYKQRVGFSDEQKYTLLMKSNCTCARCGTFLHIDTMTVEHVIPLGKGGTNSMSNLVALCRYCNWMKNDNLLLPSDFFKHLPDEYLAELDAAYNAHVEKWRDVKDSSSKERRVSQCGMSKKDIVMSFLTEFIRRNKLSPYNPDGLEDSVCKALKESRVYVIDYNKEVLALVFRHHILEGSDWLYFLPKNSRSSPIAVECLRYIVELDPDDTKYVFSFPKWFSSKGIIGNLSAGTIKGVDRIYTTKSIDKETFFGITGEINNTVNFVKVGAG